MVTHRPILGESTWPAIMFSGSAGVARRTESGGGRNTSQQWMWSNTKGREAGKRYTARPASDRPFVGGS
jgi:hypothetical protein